MMDFKILLYEYLDDPTTQPIDYLKGRRGELNNLTNRLQEDYDNQKRFEQREEDRICTYDLCGLLEFLIEKVGG